MTRVQTVERRLDFCFAHRLPNDPTACRNIHGHEATVSVEVMGTLKDNMVMPFADLKAAMVETIEQRFDHKMILRYNDPWLYTLTDVVTLGNSGWETLQAQIKASVKTQGWWSPAMVTHNPFKETMDIVLIAEAPTSENLAYLIYCWLCPTLAKWDNVSKVLVRFQETKKGAACASGQVTIAPQLPSVDG